MKINVNKWILINNKKMNKKMNNCKNESLQSRLKSM